LFCDEIFILATFATKKVFYYMKTENLLRWNSRMQE